MANIYGRFFKELIGESLDQCMSLEKINNVIENKTHKKLHIEKYNSSIVPNRGNIFRYIRFDEDLDKKIDSYLST